MTNTYDHIIITGDININTLDTSSPGYQSYEYFLDTFSLKNLIKTNTCFTKRKANHSSTSLDVLLSNNPRNFFHTSTIATGISDCHVLIGSFLRSTFRRSDPVEIEYRNYNKIYEKFDLFQNEIKNIQILPEVEDDPNKLFDQYTTAFKNILDKFAPLKSKKIRGNDGGFANKELRKAWYTKSRLCNIYNGSKTDTNWQN